MFEEIISYIRALYNKPDGVIPLHTPYFSGKEKELLNDCIDSTFVSSVGKYVDRFEELCAKEVGVKYGVATSSGTTALQLAIRVAGVLPGEEVITQSFSFVATANAISHAGAYPVFVDIDKNNLGLCPEKLEDFLKNHTKLNGDGFRENIHTGRNIKACIPMHTFGFVAKMDELILICKKYNLKLIEDAAEALGSKLNGKAAGSFGDMGIISFNGNKIITTGGGGVLLTNNKEYAERAKHLSTTAKVPHQWEFDHDEMGYNFRLPNINSALGVAQIEGLNDRLVLKRKLHESYKSFFNNIEEVNLISSREGELPNYWLNTILLKDSNLKLDFLKASNSNGINTRPAWKPLHSLEFYKNCYCGNLDATDSLYERVVNLPSTPIRG